MSAFTDFIQLELPKRPYLENDLAQNSVVIRSGIGPRQLDGVTLDDGEILMNIGGTLQAVALDDVTGGADGYIHTQDAAASTWTIEHNGGTKNVLVQFYDDTDYQFFADNVRLVDDNSLQVTFSQPMTGKATLIFFSAD